MIKNRPNRSPRNMPNLKCACGSTDYLDAWESKHDHIRLLECSTCGLKRTYPVPKSGPSARIYQDTETVYSIKRQVENKELWQFFGSKILKEVGRYKTGGNLLDIGCFIGVLLEMAKTQGWGTYGVEINRAACEYASSQLGLNVCEGELADAQFPDKFFDVIVCNHVLEHLNNPLNFLFEVKRILKPDGVLIIGSQNIESWIAKYYGNRWYALSPEQHIWQFGPKTLKAVLERGGFRIQTLTVDLLWYEYRYSPKGFAKWVSFQLIKALGKGDGILATAAFNHNQVEDHAYEISSL